MDSSEVYESSTYAALSPNNHYITSLTSDNLYVHYTSNLTLAASFSLPPSPSSRPDPNQQIHWTPDSLSIILQTSSQVTLFSLVNTNSRIKIANGSAGLGRIANLDVVGEYIIVIWEFGRVGLVDVSRGRVLEIGEVKTGLGVLRNAWSIRRGQGSKQKGKGRPDVLALLSRTNAQDVLTLTLPPETTPFKTIVLPTQDAQNISWSLDGKWLSILDSSLAAPSPAIYIYTSDGNFFRSWPASPSEQEHQQEGAYEDLDYLLGPLKQVWGTKHLALSNIDGSISLLDIKTFSLTTLLDPKIAETKTVYNESVSARGNRSWTYQTNNESISTTLANASAAVEFGFNNDGTRLYSRSEGSGEMVVVYDIPVKPSPLEAAAYQDQHIEITVLNHHATVRKLSWHEKNSALLLSVTEDNDVYILDAGGEMAPIQVSNPFSSLPANAASSSSSSSFRNATAMASTANTSTLSATATTEPMTATWIASESSSNILLSTKKRGWCIVYPSGRPETSVENQGETILFTPGKNVTTGRGGGTEENEGDRDDQDDSQDSLFDILHGRTPLPELRVSDKDGEDEVGARGGRGEAGEVDGEDDERLEDTFRGKGDLASVQSFEY